MDVDEILDEDFEEGSDDADNDFQYLNDPSSTQPSSGPPSTPNSCTSSPPINHNDESPVSTFYSQNGNTLVFSSGKPGYSAKRGPGRPRKDYPGMRGAMRDARAMMKRCRGGTFKSGANRKKLPGKEDRQQFALNGSQSQDGSFLLASSKSPTSEFLNNSMESNISSEMADKSMQLVEEPPYFPEKWPGKVCALCNLGERSQLGQGEMLRMEVSEEDRELCRTDSPTSEDKEAFSNEMSTNSNTFPQFSNRRQKGLNKCKNPVITSEYVDELEKIGHFDALEMSQIVENNYYYVHRSCATWSSGVTRDSTGVLDKVAYAVSQSLRRKCTYCNHYGASVSCKMACPKFFHFPCVSASGGFQTIQTHVSFCKEHLGQVPIICTDDINCRSCFGLGDVSNLVMCSICGDHYHGTCIGLPQLPGVRSGWQCVQCHKCQICRIPDTNEGRSLGCEQCHKVYHANCLRPVMSSIPKYGWKCRRCRVCSDCGSRTPGAGASSRWHAHYTVCDSCYQQRNKGFSCPICHKAYRASAYREMVKCSLCNKFVHSTCDSEADLAVYHSRKENNPDYDYVCPPCKQFIQSGRLNQALVRRNSHLDEELLSSLQETSQGLDELESPEVLEKSTDFGLGKGKPYAMKVSKKRIGTPFGQVSKARGKLGFGKRSRLSDMGRKRGPKAKMRGIFGVPGLSLQRPIAETNKVDDEPGIENRLVLCSAKDKFILTQDICVMCGAIGTDYEGCLISCSQCGQCYHPYCVSVKITKVILNKGWRCLDCTVCEGCGQKNDEARLILCDECDISFHIYCMDPPLEYVPQGNWKCKWCAVCQKCGRETPGKNCTWKNSYSECGPCASQSACAICSESYTEGELVIQCGDCERWLHCKCDMIKNEDDAEKCDDDSYQCVLCRPKDMPPLHLLPAKRDTSTPKLADNQLKVEELADSSVIHGLEGSHFIDGVFLSEHGLSSIKSLQMEYIRKKRKQKISSDTNNKEAGILASIESVVAGSGVDSLNEDIKVELLDPKEEAEIYKDGMVWERSDGSPPEGFALCTNEQGVVVLRKKRQRNLQKLGIGGFNVRNRAVKKDKDDYDDHGENTTGGTASNENTPTDKKRKPVRKRQKSKLVETYPVYLQEAFFGKCLLDATKANFESDSSEDDAKSNVSEDKIIKLTPEELKILESVKIENNVENPSPQMLGGDSTNFGDIKNVLMKQSPTGSILPIDVQSMTSQGEDNNDADADTLKDILPQDLLDSDLVNSIINDSDDLVKNNDLRVQYDSNVGTRKDDLPDILGPNFNLDSIGINSKDVEEIFQGVISPEPKQYSTIIKQEPSVIPLGNNQFPKATTPTDVQQYVSNSVIEDVKPPLVMNNFLPVQQSFSNSNDMQNIDQVQVHSTSSTPTQGFGSQNTGSSSSNSSLAFTASSSMPNVWSSNSQSPRQSIDFGSGQNDEPAISASTNESCSMKSTERMRRDEELGEMATKAAVLYANTNHPELKQDYPNWSDRQKQIYKRWRALSNEKKAPFLQQARDNRTALRMRKNQQGGDIDKDKDLLGSIDSADMDLSTDHNDEDDSTSRLSSCSSSVDTDTNNKYSSTYDLKESVDENDFVPSLNKKQDIKIELTKEGTQNKILNTVGCSTTPTNVAIRYKLNVIKDNSTPQQKRNVETLKDASPAKRSTFPKFYISANMNGPAPNVTVNANGAFNTGSKSVLHTYCATRPIANHFLVMNKTPVQRLSVEVPNINNCPQNDNKPVLVRSVINDEDARTKRGHIGNKNILQINSATEFLDLNNKKVNTTSGSATAINSIYLDQNIRVLTPSEIMKTLPIIPGQDSISSSASSASSSSSTTVVTDFNNRIITSGCSLVRPYYELTSTEQLSLQDQEKIASQQKSLKEQEQERQWKQLQAMRAKEQQIQQFSTQASDQTSPSVMPANTSPNFLQDQNMTMEKRSPYSSIPGTPRPQFNTDIIQPTVYATHLDTYQPPSISLNSPLQDKMGPVKQQENKQLRDLLQRQESIGGLISNPNTVINIASQGTQAIANRWSSGNENNINSTQSQPFGTSTFREPLPVTLQSRNPKLISNNPGTIRMPVTNVDMNSAGQQYSHTKLNISLESQCDNNKKLEHSSQLGNQKPTISNHMNIQNRLKIKENLSKAVSGVGTEIPDNVTAELEKLEQEESVAIGEVEGVGDILGGLGEDDDDELLKSLTAEMGADFNILEYADPELDALTGGDNQNLLDKLDFDEGDPDMKKSTEKFPHRSDPSGQGERQTILQPPMQNQMMTQAPPRYNTTMTKPSALCNMPSRTTLPPPPPPYPGPPPPYPANTKIARQQDQPLLLEDLVEQEKREQQQQQLTSSLVAGQLNEKKFITKVENLHRSATPILNNWRKNTPEIMQNPNNMMMHIEQHPKKEIASPPVLNFNCQPAPPQPPENIVTEQDRIMQINYEQWINNQNIALENQLKYFEEKITKIRKSRKSLNSKQRLVKKAGNVLQPNDAKELARIIAEQPGIQKQLDSAKKQYRQHGLLMQEYKSKHLAKIQMPSPNIPSPAQMTPHSPMLSPSTSSQSSMQIRTSPSPLGIHMLQSTRSPIQSPSPLLSHSPGGISQSPVHQSNSNPSPFNTVQASPRIGTPHSQIDENSFSPSATMSSPSSLLGRHASPAPRITSPQHRINVQQLPTRMATSPGHAYSTIIPSQSSKFNAPHSHHDRIRVQIGHQHTLLHQNQMSLDSQQQQQVQLAHQQQQQQQHQHVVSSLQMPNFQQQSTELMQNQRIHFLQQRQIMQRQNIISQVKNQQQLQQQQNQVSSPSPSHVSPSPSSPLLQCQMQQSSNSSNFILNSPDQQFMQQCGDNSNPMVDLKNYSRNNHNQDGSSNGSNNSRGGGLSSLTGGFLPYMRTGTARYGRIRLGLFGGSPMWGLSNNVTQKINVERSKCSGDRSSVEREKSGDKDKVIDDNTSVANNLSNSNQLGKSEDDVVIIDSSPDEKQRMMDYDDYQDKGFVATEVSLSSVAQNIGDNDDITVIESFTPSELTDIVSSPLETEVAEEYVLFSSDVVDYADSDDSLKPNMMTQSDDLSKKSDNSFEKDYDTSKHDSRLDLSDNHISPDKGGVSGLHNMIAKKDQSQGSSSSGISQESSNLSSQDFEAMIDSKSTKEIVTSSKSASLGESSNSSMNIVNTINAKPHITHIGSSNLMTINRIPITTVQCGLLSSSLTQTTNSTSLKVTPKKVNDVGTATTKVSFGNTTISVPLLKNMTISSPHILTSDKQGKLPANITLTKQPTILNVRGPKLNSGTIVSLSSLQLKPSTNAKIVQATVVGKKLQIPQTTVESLTNAKQNLIHNLTYPKLSTFTVLQDMTLPTKIFEDEPTSPETAPEQDPMESTITNKLDAELAQNTAVNKSGDINTNQKETSSSHSEEAKGSLSNRMESATVEEIPTKDQDCNKDSQKSQTRLISIVPLSPLSQPNEMTTNMANVSQQLRTIMSSINSNQHDQKTQCDTDSKKDVSRMTVETKVEKLLQAAQQSQQQQKHQLSYHLQQSQQNDDMKEIKSSVSSNDPLPVIAKPITSSSNKVTFLLTSTSGTTTQFQTIVSTADLHMKKSKAITSSVLATRLPSAIVVTTLASTTSANSSQTLTDSIATTINNQDASKRMLKSLHAHLASTHLKRSKSTDDGLEREKEVPAHITATKRYSLEVTPLKTDIIESAGDIITANQIQNNQMKSSAHIQITSSDTSFNGCKISTVIAQPPKSDDSQNVLLKQLLQNSTGSSTSPSAPQVLATRKVPGLRAPSLGLVSSLEAQLARPAIPPVPATPPSILSSTQQQSTLKANLETQKAEVTEDSNKKSAQVISRETSFVSNPTVKPAPKTPSPIPVQENTSSQHHYQQQQQQQQQPNLEASNKPMAATKQEFKAANFPKTNLEPLLIETKPSRTDEDMRKTPSFSDSLEIKSESNESLSLKRPNSTSLSYSTSGETPTEELDHSVRDEKSKSADIDTSAELKKKKKREYQKNRRQMQMLNKDVSFSKKRARKMSKVDGDYDMFIDNLMTQLRQMPPLQVLEPHLSRNYGICPPYGAGDLQKWGNAREGTNTADMLQGEFGNLTSTNLIDYYNTTPFGPLDMPAELPGSTIQNGFYDQEFPPIKFETDNDDRLDYSSRDWDIDAPESLVISSSPECVIWEPATPFPGLRVISDDEDEEQPYSRMSPIVPVIAPIPIRLKTGIDLSIDRKLHDNNNKENSSISDWKNRNVLPTTPSKDPNVTVTLTLSSSAAEDIMSILRDLANILHIPAPTAYQIVERTTTPPSQKLGLYRTKGKDGKEGDPIDIQTILNGAAKFCRHCDVVILNTIIRAKASEFPLLASNTELLNNCDDLYFCSKSCYKQFKWRPTNIIDDNYNLNSKLNIALESNRFAVDGYSDVKSFKVEELVGDTKNARKASTAGLDESYHKNKVQRLSDELMSRSNSQQGSDDKVKIEGDKPHRTPRYRYFTPNMFASTTKYKKSSEREIIDMLFRMNITVARVHKMPDDTRQCIFCNQVGDGVADGPSRLLNYDVDKWVHLNCALWSDGVYETENGALMNLEAALQVSLNQSCTLCHNLGATIKCFKNRCSNVYHLSCAIKDNCTFYKNKTTNCLSHVLKNEKENELTTLSVQRRVYVDRDESRQVAAVMHHSDLSNLLRVGSLTFLNVGQLLPHQLQAFHTPNYIYPIGYKIIRFYWSMRKPNKRCRYICSIADIAGRPEFRVIVQEPAEDDIELRDATPKAVWQRILEPLASLRKDHDLVQLFPKYVTGEDLFGLTEPAVVRILESLPGVETLTDYRFKYGRNPLLELPLAINPSGAARTEPKQKQAVGWRKPHTQRTGSTNHRIPLAPTITVAGEVACPYSKQFVHSKSSQYKKMKQEWRNNVFLARSKIQGLGLYAARDLEKHTMVIEYIGEVIRTEVSELREKQYEARNRGIYMFRLDEDRVVDATLSGGLARYINHSCNPNCVTEIVEVDREYRIIIFAKRRINRGEELSYDYKFDIEDDAHKISCMCGAPNCRKWMN